MALTLSGDGTISGLDEESSGIGVWSSWSPTFYNITIGNGSVTAAYTRIGNTVHAKMRIDFGSTTSVSGTIRFDPPIAASADSYRSPVGTSRLRDTGTADYSGVVHGAATLPAFEILAVRADVGYTQISGTSATVPHTWASGDAIWATFTYEAA